MFSFSYVKQYKFNGYLTHADESKLEVRQMKVKWYRKPLQKVTTHTDQELKYDSEEDIRFYHEHALSAGAKKLQ